MTFYKNNNYLLTSQFPLVFPCIFVHQKFLNYDIFLRRQTAQNPCCTV